MREAAGQTLKSGLSHSFVIDSRDDRLMTTKGYYARLFNEYAGLGGDASFYKSELEGQIARPIVDGVVRPPIFFSAPMWPYFDSASPCPWPPAPESFGGSPNRHSSRIASSWEDRQVFEASSRTAWVLEMAVRVNLIATILFRLKDALCSRLSWWRPPLVGGSKPHLKHSH